MCPNSVVNVAWRVSVSTRVPEMKVTPSTMATAVRASRSLWANSPFRVTLPISAAQLLHPFQHRVDGGRGQFVHHVPVGQEDHPVGVGRSPGVVGDHDDGLVELGDRAAY